MAARTETTNCRLPLALTTIRRVTQSLLHPPGGPLLAAPSRPASLRRATHTPTATRIWFKRSQRLLGRDWPTAYLFVALTVILLATIKAYPFLRALWFSFHNVVGFRVGAFVGLDNYIALWGDERFTGVGWRHADVHRRLGGAQAGARDGGCPAAAQPAALRLGGGRAAAGAVRRARRWCGRWPGG